MDILPQRPLDRPHHRIRLLRSRNLHCHPLHPQLRRRQLPNLLCLCTRRRDPYPQRRRRRLPSIRKPDVQQSGLRVGKQFIGFLEYHHDSHSLVVVLLWREAEIEESVCERTFCSGRGCAALSSSIAYLLGYLKSTIECYELLSVTYTFDSLTR